MKIAIMQPYFLPYIGYFQLINAVDTFVIYDNIQFTKKGWINRNRILVNGKDEYITLPLKKASDYLDINQRKLVDSFSEDKEKMLRKIMEVYKKAPYFVETYNLLNQIFDYKNSNLFEFIFHSVQVICTHCDIKTPFVVSSSINIDHTLKAEKKVLAICKELKASEYINPIGGTTLYDKNYFLEHRVNLYFLKTKPFEYAQFSNSFITYLSIIDVLMFNSKESIINFLSAFDLH